MTRPAGWYATITQPRPGACLDLGEELPKLPDISRGRAGSLVHQAAAKLGMTRQEFESEAIRMAAAQTLGANAIENRPVKMPGSNRPASGTYAKAEIQPEALRPKRVTGR